MIELISSVSSGEDFDASLKNAFKISKVDFDKGWRDAAYWAMKQGSPYEWE